MWRLKYHFDGTTRRKPRNLDAVEQHYPKPKVVTSTLGKEISQTSQMKAFMSLCN